MIKILAVILLILMVVIGDDRGARSFVSLCGNIIVLTLSIIFMANGMNPLIVALICCGILCAITLFYQNGNNEKTYAAFAAVVIVVLLLLGASCSIGNSEGIRGYNEINSSEDEVMYLSKDININMTNVAIAMIIIGILGSVMDTSVAVSTAVYEVYRNNSNMREMELFKSGMRIGKDIMGTTANTLFFACIGESIILFNLFKVSNYSFEKIINSKAFFQEFLFIMLGGIGCIMIIPITALCISYILTHKTVMDAEL